MKMICLKLFFLHFLLLANNSMSDSVTYKVADRKFEVPKSNVPDLSPWVWIKSIVGLDEDVSSFIFEFSAKEAQQYVSGYVTRDGNIDQKIIGAVYPLNEKDSIQFLDVSQYENIWYAKNGYEKREVIFDKQSGYHFVFEQKDYRGMFYVFSKYPESTLPTDLDEFFVAVCSGSSLKELKHVRCSSKFIIFNDTQIDFSIPLKNLKFYNDIRMFLDKKISAWTKQRSRGHECAESEISCNNK
jgi:hypothetical protein